MKLLRMPSSLAACLLLWTACAAAAAESSAFADAAKAYQQHDYTRASRAFAAVLQAEPKNVRAALYLANAYYELRQKTSASIYYHWVADNFPNSTEAATAQQMLARMGESTAAGTGKPAAAATATDLAKSGSAGTRTITDAEIDSMITVVRPRGDHPACTGEFISQVKNDLHKFPKPLLRFMHDQGCEICITPSLVDRNPELQNSRPRTYEQGSTYKNVPAMFQAPTVVICQYAESGDSGNWHQNNDALGSLRHEFGHAVDHYFGQVSESESFRHLYFMERSHVDGAYRGELSYYIQTGSEYGAAECFAEAFAMTQGGRDETRKGHNAMFEESFPGVIKYIKALIASLNK